MQRVLSHNCSRNRIGSSILEIPVSLWIVLMVIFIPMISLASMTLRSTLMRVVLQDAVQAAAKMRTFADSTPDGPSSVDVAAATFAKGLNAFPGLSSNPLDLDILATRISTGAVTRFPDKLQVPADSTSFVYQIEGNCKTTIEPLFPVARELFGVVPGLSAPISVNFSARQIVENPQGLHR